jgi:hypothetical protein
MSDDLDYSTLDIQKAIESVIGVGVQQAEGSERILVSKFFHVPFVGKGEPIQKEDKVRAAARFTIIGDRRPYTVEVKTILEEKTGNKDWTYSGHDQRLANQLAVQIQDYLSKHKEKNLIDHFRAF